jgi:hypothetical protein
MGRTERRWFVEMSIGFLLAASAATGAAASVGTDVAIEPSSSRSASPAAFAERITTRDSRAVALRGAAAWQNAIELIVLAGVCAIAVAYYSAATAAPTDLQSVPVRVRRH